MDEMHVKVKSLGKALKVLECFLEKPELGISEIAREMDLNKSNVSDILSTFQEMGYITHDTRTGKYRLGYRILDFSHSFAATRGYRSTVYPYMKHLAKSVGETVYFAVPDGLEVLYIDAAYPDQEYRTRTMLGDRAPMYCTGLGKAMLSRMDESAWQPLMTAKLRAYTTETITDPAALRRELLETKSRGYSIDNMEHEYGIRCVGVAVMNDLGEVAAGLSISCPSLRMDDQKLEEYGAMLREIAEKISSYF